MFSMHTAHLANVSKSVTKNATFSRTGGLPCLITHSCMSAASPTVGGGLIFCISATPQPGCLFPLFHERNGHLFEAKNIVFLRVFRNYSVLDALKSSYLSKVDIWNPNDILDDELSK